MCFYKQTCVLTSRKKNGTIGRLFVTYFTVLNRVSVLPYQKVSWLLWILLKNIFPLIRQFTRNQCCSAVGVNLWHSFASRLFHFWSTFLVELLGKLQKMAQGLGPLTPVWKTQLEFLAPSWSLVQQPWLLWPFGEWSKWKILIQHSLSLLPSLTFFPPFLCPASNPPSFFALSSLLPETLPFK